MPASRGLSRHNPPAAGFISLGIILLIIIGLAALGGSAYWANHRVPSELNRAPNDTASGTLAIAVRGVVGHVLTYQITGPLPADVDIWLGLLDTQSNKEVWGEEGVKLGETSIDLSTLSKHGIPISIPPGAYSLRLSDFHTGTVFMQSSSFVIPAP